VVVALLYRVGAMTRVEDARPVDFWDLWCPSIMEMVAGEGSFTVEVVDMVGEEFDYAVAMVVEVAS
jgi:hypothetical protein